MGYIYVIRNDINKKVYIGKTIDTLSNRFSKHKWDAINKSNTNCPLHNAMNKYGIEHFHIEPLEECDNEILSQREIYWIKYFNSYLDNSKGYNATSGGEGNPKYDQDSIIFLWKKGYNQKQIADKLSCDRHTISKSLSNYGIDVLEKQKFKHGNASKPVYQIDKKTNKIIAEYPSVTIAAKETNSLSSGISLVCNGKRKTHNNYIWKYKEK